MVSTYFSLQVKSSDTVRVIISVSKKVSKSAVVRNTIRRRIRPIIRELTPNLKTGTYLIVVKPNAEKIKGEELKNELIKLIRSIRN